MKDRTLVLLVGGGIVGLVVVILLMMASPFTQTNGGEYAVVRNGGWFDDRSVQQVIPPGSGMTPSGFWSTVHRYPSTQRNFVVSAVPTADSNEVIIVPSKDGFKMGIEGTFYFRLTGDPKTLSEFDDRFGTRTYPTKDGPKFAWEDGDEGWNAFLGFTLGNLVQNDLRREVLKYECAQLVASCSLAQNNATGAAPVVTTSNTDQIAAIQTAVNTSIATEINTTLGGKYFEDIQFVLAKADIPAEVDQAVKKAQAAFALVTEAQARKQQAVVDAQANAEKQNGYNACPSCARQDENRSLPPGITTYAPGAAVAVGPR